MADDLSALKIEKSPRGVGRRGGPGKKILLACLTLVALLALGFLYRDGLLTPSVTVQAATVSRVYPSQTFTLLNASGYVVAQRKSAVSSKVTGRLVWLGVEEGSKRQGGADDCKAGERGRDGGTGSGRANVSASQLNLDQAKAELADATLGDRTGPESFSPRVI